MNKVLTTEERFWSKVSKSDGCWEWSAFKPSNGYGQFRLNGRAQLAHRVSYALAYGTIADGMQVDHRCHNRSCVRPAHLRLTTNKQNNENLTGARRGTSSGVRGVTWDKGWKKWRAHVKHNGVAFSLGGFDTIAEAEAAAVTKRLELFTHNDRDRSPAFAT